MIKPEKLNRGDKIAIICPASAVKEEYIDRACEFLEERGLQPIVMPHAKGPASGSFSSDKDSRLSDFVSAWSNPEIKAVLCGRGGYGATHLLPYLPTNIFRDNPKWLIGFSDISALHAAITAQGVMSIHGPMTRHFVNEDPGAEMIMQILMDDKLPEFDVTRKENPLIPDNHPGRGAGRLYGGNVAVLNGLAATPYDIFQLSKAEDVILFIEDIAEPIYKIERVLYRLLMQGVFDKLTGLIVGQFTEYRPSADHQSMELMIEKFLKDNDLTHFPVVYDFPCGHIEGNMPLMEGAFTEIDVKKDSAKIIQTSV